MENLQYCLEDQDRKTGNTMNKISRQLILNEDERDQTPLTYN